MPKAGAEAVAREDIDRRLSAAGWILQDRDDANLLAGVGVAVREFPLRGDFADYLLYVDGAAAGAIEAKPVGHTRQFGGRCIAQASSTDTENVAT
jgi:type I restriction enzyme R subunit